MLSCDNKTQVVMTPHSRGILTGGTVLGGVWSPRDPGSSHLMALRPAGRGGRAWSISVFPERQEHSLPFHWPIAYEASSTNAYKRAQSCADPQLGLHSSWLLLLSSVSYRHQMRQEPERGIPRLKGFSPWPGSRTPTPSFPGLPLWPEFCAASQPSRQRRGRGFSPGKLYPLPQSLRPPSSPPLPAVPTHCTGLVES